jgi:hypothetical protein
MTSVTVGSQNGFAAAMAFRIGAFLSNRAARERTNTSNRARVWLLSFTKLVMHLAGFGCLTLAGFSWNMTAGLITAGMSFFVLSWLVTGNSSTSDQHDSQAPMAGLRR